MKQKDVRVIFSEFDAYCQALDRNGCISYPATIIWNGAGQDYGHPVVVILQEPRQGDDLPPGELQVPWEILQEVRGQSAKEVRGQSAKKDKRKGGFFGGTPIENPIRFVEVNTTRDWSVAKSFWMLMRIAFDTEDPAPLRIKGIHL